MNNIFETISEQETISVTDMAKTKPFHFEITIPEIIITIIILLLIFVFIVIFSTKLKINHINNISTKTDIKLENSGNYTKGETEEDKKKNITFVYQELMKQDKLRRKY